jgi:hypothetical protein
MSIIASASVIPPGCVEGMVSGCSTGRRSSSVRLGVVNCGGTSLDGPTVGPMAMFTGEVGKAGT